jgi:hypothetical protein
MMTMMNTTQIEAQIVSMIIDSCFSSGYAVRIYDGELWASSIYDTKEEHLASIHNTDMESLVVFNRDTRKRVGSIELVYGNDGCDVIHDYTDNIEINDILSEVFAWIDEHEENNS